MKNLLLALVALPLLLCSCRTLSAVLDVPAAAAGDVAGAVDVVTPGDQTIADTAGTVAQTGTTLVTGNSALGAAAGALATGLAAWFLAKRRKAAAA